MTIESYEIEYLVHRLYEDFDVITVHEVDSAYCFWLGKYTDEGRVMFSHIVPHEFDVDLVELEIEYLRQRFEQEKERHYTKN